MPLIQPNLVYNCPFQSEWRLYVNSSQQLPPHLWHPWLEDLPSTHQPSSGATMRRQLTASSLPVSLYCSSRVLCYMLLPYQASLPSEWSLEFIAHRDYFIIPHHLLKLHLSCGSLIGIARAQWQKSSTINSSSKCSFSIDLTPLFPFGRTTCPQQSITSGTYSPLGLPHTSLCNFAFFYGSSVNIFITISPK